MALRKNDALINAEATAFKDLFDGGTLQIRSGGQPANPNSGATGTLLATINLPDPAFGAAAGGVISKTGVWQAVAVANGTAGWARFISADTTHTFDVSVAESAADLIIDDDAIVSGGVVTCTGFTFTCPNGV